MTHLEDVASQSHTARDRDEPFRTAGSGAVRLIAMGMKMAKNAIFKGDNKAMCKKINLLTVLLTILVSLAGMSANAVTIDASELTSFLYEGRSYVPLNSTANFLGASLRWDAENGRAVINYKGEDLALKPNSVKALFAGRPVELASPPVVVGGRTYVPTEAFKKFYNVPVEWNKAKSEMKIKGPDGWRTIKASSRSPWHGGPPPWAPAWGERGYNASDHPNNAKPNTNRKIKGNKKGS